MRTQARWNKRIEILASLPSVVLEDTVDFFIDYWYALIGADKRKLPHINGTKRKQSTRR